MKITEEGLSQAASVIEKRKEYQPKKLVSRKNPYFDYE
jgi:hypothetical protein